LRDSWVAIATLGGLLILVLGVMAYGAHLAALPAERITGEIVRFGSGAEYEGNYPLIVVRLADGSTRQFGINRGEVAFCRVGGAVALLRRRGNRIALAPSACRLVPIES
jgi:hypothetical protein